ncbi:kelch-like protein 25 [Clavelina lepadiformis]|uniref:kelch-like protein 25 n=1 Tax=Clavelina lepadiformis TaxID=159417 RepID=UPI0040413FA1
MSTIFDEIFDGGRFNSARFIWKSTSVTRGLNKDREGAQTFCDFTIICENKQFKVHKCVLGSISEYFRILFTSKLKPVSQDKAIFKEFSAETMGMLLQHVYSDENVINPRNFFQILEAADFLMMSSVKVDCGKFIDDNTTPGNFLKIWLVATKYALDVKQYQYFMKDNYKFLLNKKDQVLELDFNDFQTLLDYKKPINSTDENHDCFKLILSWVKHDPESRKKHFEFFFGELNLQKFTLTFIQRVRHDEFLSEVPHIAVKLEKAANSFEHCSSYDLHRMSHIKNLYPNPHRNVSEDYDLCVDDLVFKLDENQSSLLPKDDVIRTIQAAHDSTFCSDESPCFDFCHLTKQHEKLFQGLQRAEKRNMGCAIYDGVVYIAGGLLTANSFALSSVECLSPDARSWVIKPNMNMKRGSFSLVACRGKLYALGGKLSLREATNKVECFDGKTWKFVASMKQKRFSFAAVLLGDCILVIGGRKFITSPSANKTLCCEKAISSVEAYHVSSNTWRDVAPTRNGISGHSACVFKGKIYVVGNHKLCGMYDPVKNLWVWDKSFCRILSNCCSTRTKRKAMEAKLDL